MLLIPTTKSALFYFDKQRMRNSHAKFKLTGIFSRESVSSVKLCCDYYKRVLLLLQFSLQQGYVPPIVF
jgi:hypothetical protein